MMVWDTCGQERFRCISPSFYRGSDGCIIAFDITDRDNYHKVEYWMDELFKHSSDNIIRCLVGCKSDLEHKR